MRQLVVSTQAQGAWRPLEQLPSETRTRRAQLHAGPLFSTGTQRRSGLAYRGPAPVESGVLKGRQLRRSGYDRIKDIEWLNKDSSVRKFSREKRLNNLVYMESQ